MYSLRNPSEFIEESELIYWGIQVNLLRNPSECMEESWWIHSGILWIHWGILVNSLRNPSEFIEESEWIYWGIQVNLFKNLSEFIEKSEGIHWGIWVICWFQLNLFNSNESIELKKILKWLKSSVLVRRPFTLVLVCIVWPKSILGSITGMGGY